jgi:hypothetical protein
MGSAIKILGIVLILSGNHLYSQSSFNSGGSSSGGPGGSVSISIGQVANGSFSGDNRNLTVGVQQAQNSTTSGVSLAETLGICVFPNPFSSELFVSHPENLIIKRYKVMDLSGRIISSREFYGKSESINLSRVPSGAYLIYFMTDDQKIIQHKIIKHNP